MIDRMIGALGRISLSLMFLAMGIIQIFDWRAADQEVSMVLMDWKEAAKDVQLVTLLYENTYLLIALAIFAEICGGLLLLFGYRVKLGTGLLIGVWLPVVVFQHPFYLLSGVERDRELMGFLLNLAVLGGLFSLLGLTRWERRYARPRLRFRGDE